MSRYYIHKEKERVFLELNHTPYGVELTASMGSKRAVLLNISEDGKIERWPVEEGDAWEMGFELDGDKLVVDIIEEGHRKALI